MNMRISELIVELQKIEKKEGDLEVSVQTFSHLWPPEPTVRCSTNNGQRYVLLNP